MSNILKEYGKYRLVYLSGIDARYEILITTEQGSEVIFETSSTRKAQGKFWEIIEENRREAYEIIRKYM